MTDHLFAIFDGVIGDIHLAVKIMSVYYIYIYIYIYYYTYIIFGMYAFIDININIYFINIYM